MTNSVKLKCLISSIGLITQHLHLHAITVQSHAITCNCCVTHVYQYVKELIKHRYRVTYVLIDLFSVAVCNTVTINMLIKINKTSQSADYILRVTRSALSKLLKLL